MLHQPASLIAAKRPAQKSATAGAIWLPSLLPLCPRRDPRIARTSTVIVSPSTDTTEDAKPRRCAAAPSGARAAAPRRPSVLSAANILTKS